MGRIHSGKREGRSRGQINGKQGGTVPRERRLRKLAAIEIRTDGFPTSGPRSPAREAVLRAFRRKAKAVGLTDAELEDVMHRVLVHEVRRGRYLLTPGDTPAFVSVVGVGAIKTVIPSGIAVRSDSEGRKESGGQRSKLTERWLTVQFAKPGYVAGLTPISLRANSRRFAAVAHCDSVVAEMPRDVIVQVFGRTPPQVRLMMAAYHWRALSRLIAEQCRLLPLSTKERLRCVLSELARDFPRPGYPGMIGLEIHHQDFADRIGKERTGIVRAFKSLRAAVHYDRNQKRYVVHENLLRREECDTATESPAIGFPVDDSERETFTRALRRAMHQMGLPSTVFSILLAGAELRSYDTDDIISVDERLHATVLVSGAARVLVRVAPERDVGVWIAKPGHFIGAGWISSIGGQLPAFRAVAHGTGTGEPCQVAILKQDVMLRVMDALSPTELLTFLAYCHDALSRQLYDRTVMLPFGIPERLLYQLYVLATDFPRGTHDGTIINLPLSCRRDLAPLIAANGSQTTRALNDLRDAGRIDVLNDGRIVVLGLYLTRSAA